MTKSRILLITALIVTVASCGAYIYYTEYKMDLDARCEAGDPEAMFQQGASLCARCEFKAGSEWLLKAADAGYSEAQLRVGYMYAFGRGVTKDDKEALRWLLMSAEQGEVSAQVSVGAFYLTGRGVEQDVTKAVEWYEKAAAQSSKPALNKLIQIYSSGKNVDLEKAKRCKLTFEEIVKKQNK